MTRKCISCIYYSFLLRSNIFRIRKRPSRIHTIVSLTPETIHKCEAMRGNSYDFAFCFPFVPFLSFSRPPLPAVEHARDWNALSFSVMPGKRFNLLPNLIKICLEFGVYLFCFVRQMFEMSWNWICVYYVCATERKSERERENLSAHKSFPSHIGIGIVPVKITFGDFVWSKSGIYFHSYNVFRLFFLALFCITFRIGLDFECLYLCVCVYEYLYCITPR